jgi:hypothetical protein
MSGFFEILRSYPLLSAVLIVAPLLGGVGSGLVGAYLGYDNLTGRLEQARQQQRLENRTKEISDQLATLSIPIETIRRYEQDARANADGFDVLRRVLSQYDQLRNAMTQRERSVGSEDQQERVVAAEQILGELKTLLGATQTVPGPGGQALIIKAPMNTFRVIFAVPMRIPPNLTFTGIPSGVEANVIEKSIVGFTVIFTPSSMAVDEFGFIASADF